MQNYDWLIIGGGFTGATLAYELAQKGCSVLLMEQASSLQNATRYSYGGLAYWSGTTPITRQLCKEGIERHRQLSEELEAETEFRELDLLLTIDASHNPTAVAQGYEEMLIPPQLLNPQEAIELEPLLNPEAISGALYLPHGHINPYKTNLAYLQAFQRLGGKVVYEEVIQLYRQGDKVQGVQTATDTYTAGNTVVCAGGFSRALFKAAGISIPLYFTYTEIIETLPVDLRLQTLIMPASNQRLELEDQAVQSWDKVNSISSILDAGAIQFLNGRLILGQQSRVIPHFHTEIDAAVSEKAIRQGIKQVLPALADLPGKLHSCIVAFAPESLPLVGAIPHLTGVYTFSGFTSTLLFAPPLAKHFSRWAVGKKDTLMEQLSYK